MAFSSKKIRSILLVILLVLCALPLSACITKHYLKKEIASADRDPITGVIRGCEAVTLQPASDTALTTPTACLLVHGFMAARSDFNDLGQDLAAKGFTVRMLRLPGHGTTAPDFAWQPDGALLKGVEAEYRALRAQYPRVYVIGFSMGGALSTLLASEERPDKLVLTAPYYGVTYQWYYVLPAETWNKTLGFFISYLIRPKNMEKVNDHTARGKFFHYNILTTSGARQLIDLGEAARQDSVLAKIKSPLLMVHSKNDEAASFAAAKRVFGKIGSARKEFMELERSNHMLFWDYDHDAVKQKIAMFLLEEEK
ncbi:TPA: hypothetical protein DDW35_07735 [Candidatus Sumerlaeota bacterium]|nr:hypothetical protein [Candidatus Sumerlaeota bacterium]